VAQKPSPENVLTRIVCCEIFSDVHTHVDCDDLREAIRQRPSLKAIIFGHVHHSYGARQLGNQWFINAAQYNGIHKGDFRNEPFEIWMRLVDRTSAVAKRSRLGGGMKIFRPR
jgi:hypothetical protein